MAAASLPRWMVTGAPGGGTSVIAAALLAAPSAALLFDSDWLTLLVSTLVGQSISEARPLWPAYNHLWVAIVEMVTSNRRPVLFFSPLDRATVAAAAVSTRFAVVQWCLLDCDDATRAARVGARVDGGNDRGDARGCSGVA